VPEHDRASAAFNIHHSASVEADPARAPATRDISASALNFLSYENRAGNPAAPLLFAGFIGLQLALLYAFIRYFFRETWNAHLESGAGAIVLTCLICNVALCFGEYFFHRYVLHLETVRFLRALCRSHRAHHKLTSIQFDDARQTVRSTYPIDEVARDDQATFPPWALVPFFAFFTPFFAPMAFSFPWLPILIGGYAAIAIAHFLYEVIHVIHHQPYEWWRPRLESRSFGVLWRKLYGFHLAHHANYKCNLNVAGFFGIPVADLMFGTYKQPDPLPIDGANATKELARRLTPQPRWPIAWLDRVSFKRRRWMAKRP
jgi:hemolysin III